MPKRIMIPYSESLHLPHSGVFGKLELAANFLDMSAITVSKLSNKDWGPLPDVLYAEDFELISGHPFLYNWLAKPSSLVETVAFAPGKFIAKSNMFKRGLINSMRYLDGLIKTIALDRVLNKLDDRVIDLSFVGNNKFWYLSSRRMVAELYFPYFNDDDSFDSFRRIRNYDEAKLIDPDFLYWRDE